MYYARSFVHGIAKGCLVGIVSGLIGSGLLVVLFSL